MVGFGVVGGGCMGAALPFSVIAGLSKKCLLSAKILNDSIKELGC